MGGANQWELYELVENWGRLLNGQSRQAVAPSVPQSPLW
jgi:hypothetical protein